ncbi:MAG: hypothetical protein EA402_01940 [Planctomycetota bacterium]|nr:MAG: hypothetical protein EA402_01940 [Planctomycetota bacterium]
MTLDTTLLLPGILTTLGQSLAVIILLIGGGIVSGLILRRAARLSDSETIQLRLAGIQRSIRHTLLLIGIISTLALLGWNAYLVADGVDPWRHFLNRVIHIDPDLRNQFLQGLGLTILYIIGAKLLNRIIIRAAGYSSQALSKWGRLEANDEAIARFFRGLQRALTNTVWLAVLILTCMNLQLPDLFLAALWRLAIIYLIISVGLCIIRITAVIVDTADGLSGRYLEQHTWSNYYRQLRPLIPLLRRCLEYILWIGVATLVMAQLPALDPFVAYGPMIIQAIGIFFLARVGIELTHLFIDQVMLGDQDIPEAERKRRITIVPLIKTISKQVIYFASFVLILSSAGFDPMPFLAGAGVLGVVIGLGAQPLINDVVSGFFILFENTFLVGDTIRSGDTYGSVVAIDFRTTRIRDFDGNLHVLRNGDLRHVINYSKDFTHAVLEIAIGHDGDLEQALNIIANCGAGLEADERVRGPLLVRGVTRVDSTGVHLRAVMEVVPGEHFSISAQLRARAITALQQAGVPLAVQQRVSWSSAQKSCQLAEDANEAPPSPA